MSHFCEKEFFGSLNETDLCDQKICWDAIKPLLSNKVAYDDRITIVENVKL